MLATNNNDPLRMFFTILASLHALATLLGRLNWLRNLQNLLARRFRPRTGYRGAAAPTRAFPHSPAKPAWVRKEVLRLKALMPQAAAARYRSSSIAASPQSAA